MDVLGNIFSNIIWFIFAFWAIGAASVIANAIFRSSGASPIGMFVGLVVGAASAIVFNNTSVKIEGDILRLLAEAGCAGGASFIVSLISALVNHDE